MYKKYILTQRNSEYINCLNTSEHWVTQVKKHFNTYDFFFNICWKDKHEKNLTLSFISS